MNKADGLILLLGQTGVGKSTFINHAVGEEVATVGHVYDSSTSEVSDFIAAQSTSNPRRIMLIDTPGFNDVWSKDIEILAQIIAWLKRLDSSEKFYGVLYLVPDATRRNAMSSVGLITPSNLCQPSLVKNVCIASVVRRRPGYDRPDAVTLESNARVKWKFMEDSGAQIRRFEPSHQSASNILEGMSQIAPVPLHTFIREMEILHNQFSTPGMILILGQSGVGKSTFVNDAAGKDIATVRDDYEDCPLIVSDFDVESPPTSSRYINVKLVDTPGFNDQLLDDVQILEEIIRWMKEQNRRDGSVKLYGILYLHDILRYNPMRTGTPVTPDSLSQPHLVKNIFLATVGWTGKDIPEYLIPREEKLRTNSWNLMCREGSQILRFDHTQRSAWDIIEKMTTAEPIPVGMFVREMENIHKKISQKNHGLLRGFFSFLFERGRHLFSSYDTQE